MSKPDELRARRLAADIQDALSERDVFRLVIRGYAAVERLIRYAVEDAFETAPDLPAWARLELATSLGIVDRPLAGAIEALSGIRHDFAHGNEVIASEARMQTMRRALEPLFVEVLDLEPYSSRDQLDLAIRVIWENVQLAIEQQRGERARTEEGMRLWRENHRLTREQLEALMRDDGEPF